MKCRSCSATLTKTVIDLGSAPLSNALLTSTTLRSPESWYPLRVLVCHMCWLVQVEEYSNSAEIFSSEYTYFSSFSESWLRHSREFQEQITSEMALSADSFVVEIASNDGYLLQYFVEADIPCLGIEPTASTAAAAEERGIPTRRLFFDTATAQTIRDEYRAANLIVGNNVLAHVPDPLDFLQGVRLLLDENGIATFEFPHLLSLVQENQFDTIYHEHFSYFSIIALQSLLERSGLTLVRVKELSTHGGSLRLYTMRSSSPSAIVTPSVERIITLERAAGLDSIEAYSRLQKTAEQIKDDLLAFLIEAKRLGKRVLGYGAAAKGNTLLNYAGVKSDLLPLVVDKNPFKIGKYLPGSRIPVLSEAAILRERPDFILVLPWNLLDEVSEQLSFTRRWGAQFVRAIPEVEVR